MITCWKRTGLLDRLCVVFSCVFVTFYDGVPGQLWYSISSIPDLCFPLYFNSMYVAVDALCYGLSSLFWCR